ncbi:MAG TPA: RecX family transcriptional regulator [Rectinemataceae bacterium]
MRIESIRYDASGAAIAAFSGGVVFSIPAARLEELEPVAPGQDIRAYLEKAVSEKLVFEETDAFLLALRRIDAEERALSLAARLCARAEQHSSSLELKLLSKGFNRGEIQRAMSILKAEGILDDARYALFWARARLRRRPQGPRSLASELRARGLGRDDVESALACIDFSEILPHALAYLERQGKRARRAFDERLSLRASLIAQGFATSAVDSLLEARKEEEFSSS